MKIVTLNSHIYIELIFQTDWHFEFVFAFLNIHTIFSKELRILSNLCYREKSNLLTKQSKHCHYLRTFQWKTKQVLYVRVHTQLKGVNFFNNYLLPLVWSETDYLKLHFQCLKSWINFVIKVLCWGRLGIRIFGDICWF